MNHLAGTAAALRPPRRLSLSEWADEHFVLSPESSAVAGRWRSLPYQRGVLDALSDPAIERVTWMKSARVGATKILNAAIAYYIAEDPCSILVVQPTEGDAQGYSKEEIAPMIRDVDAIRELVADAKSRTSESTILQKSFAGGVLSMVGANSPAGFRRVSRRVVLFDEVDGYPPSAGQEGDQIRLGIMRTQHFFNRKIAAMSTPTVRGVSRIEPMFEAGDQRRYHVPCPHCGHMDFLVFRLRDDGRGHVMSWDRDDPASAHFVCADGGCVIEERDKHSMIAAGGWVADAPLRGHASFHIWAAYSYAANATWSHLVGEFLSAKSAGPVELQVFVNTWLGETWEDAGEAPSDELLYLRSGGYERGHVPAPVVAVTAGVDVQQDRFVYEIVGWGRDRQSWSIEHGQIYCDTADDSAYLELDKLLDTTLAGVDGAPVSVRMLAIDSGYRTQQVYRWGRTKPANRVIAVKGVGGGSAAAASVVGAASPVDVKMSGRKVRRGYRVWPVCGDVIKTELYGWLQLETPGDGDPFPPGWCHFPEGQSREFFRQLTGEQLVTVKRRSGRAKREWRPVAGSQNHFLDARVYARAAAYLLGVDRLPPGRKPEAPAPKARSRKGPDEGRRRVRGKGGKGWIGRRSRRGGRGGGGGWLG